MLSIHDWKLQNEELSAPATATMGRTNPSTMGTQPSIGTSPIMGRTNPSVMGQTATNRGQVSPRPSEDQDNEMTSRMLNKRFDIYIIPLLDKPEMQTRPKQMEVLQKLVGKLNKLRLQDFKQIAINFRSETPDSY